MLREIHAINDLSLAQKIICLIQSTPDANAKVT